MDVRDLGLLDIDSWPLPRLRSGHLMVFLLPTLVEERPSFRSASAMPSRARFGRTRHGAMPSYHPRQAGPPRAPGKQILFSQKCVTNKWDFPLHEFPTCKSLKHSCNERRENIWWNTEKSTTVKIKYIIYEANMLKDVLNFFLTI